MNDHVQRFNDADLWALEKELWLGGIYVYESRVAPDALLIVPGPEGVLTRSQTIELIRQSPRWSEVAFESAHAHRPAANVALLAYEATGQRDGLTSAYRARCGSVYVEEMGRWVLIFHQQTPL